jgi:hypothetical protein
MRDGTSFRLRELHPAPRTAFRSFRLLASILLMLGILAGSNRMGLQAQIPGSSEEKKDLGKTPELPRAVPVPLPGAPSSQPIQAVELRPDAPAPVPQPQRFQFTIDPKTPLKDLLPVPPKIERRALPVKGNDLSLVPEVQFEGSQASANTQAPKHILRRRLENLSGRDQGGANAGALKHIAHQIAKINHLNDKKTDGFIESLRSDRPDLTGLPFAMGDACRTKGERSKQFAIAVAMVRQALQPPPVPVAPSSGPQQASSPAVTMLGTVSPLQNGNSAAGATVMSSTVAVPPATVDPPSPEAFWDQYQSLCDQQDKSQIHARCEQRELIALTRIAALSQILMPMTQMHPGFAKYLSTVSHVEATRALARLAIFSADEDSRKAAIEALKVRRERDYTEILIHGLRYPWPAVARRAAEAIAKLDRNDLLPQLIDVLEQPDPRAPVMQEIKGKNSPVVSELVRVNHHRSCLLCHAPGNTGKVSADAVTAEVPVPGQPLTPPSGGYNTSQPDILVRVDVTYLRQDFSALLAVADANPWPEMQRFDFLVRTRMVSDEEAAEYREKLKPREAGEFSPYQRAALAALRELTRRDTEPTPEAWRRLLKLPADAQQRQKKS